jgi:hypothetical protein
VNTRILSHSFNFSIFIDSKIYKLLSPILYKNHNNFPHIQNPISSPALKQFMKLLNDVSVMGMDQHMLRTGGSAVSRKILSFSKRT